MSEAGLTDIQTSIQRRQNTVAQYIATRPLLDLCEGARPREGARVTLRWWEQSGIDWEKSKGDRNRHRNNVRVGNGDRHRGGGGAGRRKKGKRIKRAEWSRASVDDWA